MKKLVEESIKLLGGADNIIKIDHCITRVRLNVADYAKVNFADLNSKYDCAVKGMSEGSVHLVVNQFKHEFAAADVAAEIIKQKG